MSVITQSKRTAVIAKACGEFNEKFERALKSGVHSYSFKARDKKDKLISKISLKYGVKKLNLELILKLK